MKKAYNPMELEDYIKLNYGSITSSAEIDDDVLLVDVIHPSERTVKVLSTDDKELEESASPSICGSFTSKKKMIHKFDWSEIVFLNGNLGRRRTSGDESSIT